MGAVFSYSPDRLKAITTPNSGRFLTDIISASGHECTGLT
jgi:hypothetical protein